jgi:Icc-related predicted phosphoesterase
MALHCFFVSDLHGKKSRYQSLFRAIEDQKPDALFIGGDLLPSGLHHFLEGGMDFGQDFFAYLFAEFQKLKEQKICPEVFLIPGNDDGRGDEQWFLEGENRGLWHYLPNGKTSWQGFHVIGYAYVPPTPFLLKDWEKYDVSAYVDPGCVSPEEGYHSVERTKYELRYGTIQKDLQQLTEGVDMHKSIFLFHSPPYETLLDRAALDGKMIDYVPLDVHVGSIAIKRMIEEQQPWLTLHGHIHESTRLTGSWMQKLNKTVMINAAHDGHELSLVTFNPEKPGEAQRVLVNPVHF